MILDDELVFHDQLIGSCDIAQIIDCIMRRMALGHTNENQIVKNVHCSELAMIFIKLLA
jgi:hypothetical protein